MGWGEGGEGLFVHLRKVSLSGGGGIFAHLWKTVYLEGGGGGLLAHTFCSYKKGHFIDGGGGLFSHTISNFFAEIFASQGAPPVSTTPGMGRISDCLHLKWTWRKKIIYGNSTTQRCPHKIFKPFLIEAFSVCHRCQRHRWCTLSCENLSELKKKI